LVREFAILSFSDYFEAYDYELLIIRVSSELFKFSDVRSYQLDKWFGLVGLPLKFINILS